MTPEEKAKEIVKKFILRRTAIICCDEIIAEIEDLQQNCLMEFPMALKYWHQVKEHIQQL